MLENYTYLNYFLNSVPEEVLTIILVFIFMGKFKEISFISFFEAILLPASFMSLGYFIVRSSGLPFIITVFVGILFVSLPSVLLASNIIKRYSSDNEKNVEYYFAVARYFLLTKLIFLGTETVASYVFFIICPDEVTLRCINKHLDMFLYFIGCKYVFEILAIYIVFRIKNRTAKES